VAVHVVLTGIPRKVPRFTVHGLETTNESPAAVGTDTFNAPHWVWVDCGIALEKTALLTFMWINSARI
jgi:hypothetical protein